MLAIFSQRRFKRAFVLAGLFFAAIPFAASAQADPQSLISQRQNDISALEAEIQGYQSQLDSLGKQSDSLQTAISQLDLSKKQLTANSKVTESKIDIDTAQIAELAGQISSKRAHISHSRAAAIKALQSIDQEDDASAIKLLLGAPSLSEAMNAIEALAAFDKSVNGKIVQFQDDKARLEGSKKALEAKKADLVSLQKQLKGQLAAVAEASAEKAKLLADTHDSQASYAALIADRKAKEQAFADEILRYEQALHLSVSRSSLPAAGRGVLIWPLASVRITQYFGNTAFSTQNPQIYSGHGHTGVDFAASIGTPVMAASDGIVSGSGDTDRIAGCYSFGKWIMVQHPNGLSTLYAHLSYIGVGQGDQVGAGQIIGYSGNTGYTTGPHLHFGVYATAGTRVTTFDNSINCKGAVVPIADLTAYLNPLSYL